MQGGHTRDAGYQQGRKKVHVAVWLFDGDLRNLARCREDEIRMVNAVILAIGHSDDKWLERCAAEQFADACFHGLSGSTAQAKRKRTQSEALTC